MKNSEQISLTTE